MKEGRSTDIRVSAAELYLLPVMMRVPLKFGTEVMTEVTCARVRVTVGDRSGNSADGWGETPLNVQWGWPSALEYRPRHDRMVNFTSELTRAWAGFDCIGHPLEVGYDFIQGQLPDLITSHDAAHPDEDALPWLAALICCSAFDLAVHDAFGRLLQRDTYDLYGPEFLSRDLGHFLEPATGSRTVSFAGAYPEQFLIRPGLQQIPAWHLVGGLDPLSTDELTGDEPDDGYPVVLTDWIDRDGLTCLKVKLRGNDAEWDYARLVDVGRIAIDREVVWLTADFNCTVSEPEYVNEILDRLRDEHPCIYGMLLYIEQPFPYDLAEHAIDCRSVAARKPVFLDESAHDWQHVRLGRELGWSGVALKTCKTQTGAILSLCWARAHGMPLMVQDLANPMLAQITHGRLAAHAGTIMGVETNGMQFYPEASGPEAAVHPGLFRRRNGSVNLATLGSIGMGHRVDEMSRTLPAPEAVG